MPVIQRYAPDVVLEAGRREPTEEEYRRKVYQTYGMPGALAYIREGELSYETQQKLWQERQRRREVQMRREAQEYHLLGALVMMHQEAPLSKGQKEAISTYYTEYKAYKQRIATGEILSGYKIQQIAYRAGAWPGLQVFGELKPHEYYEISEWQVIHGAKLGEKIYQAQRISAPKESTWEETTLTGWILKRQEPLIPTQKMFTSLLPIKRSEALVSAAETIQPKYPYAFVAGLTSIGESWLRPEIPTPTGALVGYALGRPEQIEAYQRLPPEYLIGGLFGTYFEMKATGYAVGKAWAGVKKIPGVAKATGKVGTTWERHVTEPVMKRMPQFIQKQFYGAEYVARVTERELVWAKPPFAGYEEFYLQIETPLMTKLAPEKWFITIKGTQTTPFSKTLERAITAARPLGGISATQQIVVTQFGKKATISAPQRLFPTALTVGTREGLKITPLITSAAITTALKLRTTARVRDIQTGKVSVTLKQPSLPKISHIQVTSPVQIPSVTQIVSPTQLVSTQQASKQITQQIQKQTQRLMQVTIRPPQITRQTFKPPTFRLPSTTTRKRRKMKGLGTEWFFKKHKLMTPKEMLQQFTGSHSRRKRRM